MIIRKQNYSLLILFLGSLSLVDISCSKKGTDERSPESALKDLQAHDGLEVTLFASEPMLTNPTNIDVDSRGRVWVCEAYNYRSQLNPKNPTRKEGDRILILEDTDDDGKADVSKVFYQGTDVNAALGISVLGNRVIISCSPNVLVFTDENADDVPDKKEILFKGIHGEQHDHGMHAFVFGPDGRLYFNFGNAGEVLLNAKGDTVIDVHGKKVNTGGKPFQEGLVMRSNLEGGDVEVLAQNFRNNFEVTIDPYGALWQSDNDDDGNKSTRINFVMEYGNYGYKDEITGAGWDVRRTNMEKEIPFRHWHLNDPGVVPNLLQTGAGSPTGITIYDGTLLPEVFHGQIIHCDAGPNVVRSYPIQNDGAGYKARIVPILQIKKDQWFRPSDVCVAPDGSLIVADWYDPGVGGHQVGDLERGRIYRVAPPNSKYKTEPIDISTPEGAVKALVSPNYSTRYLGWTSLEKFKAKGEKALASLWNSKNDRQRAQALWLLSRLSNGDTYLDKGFNDINPDIRITALRCARQQNKDILTIARRLVNDTSAQVRREIAIALRGNATPEAAEIWSTLAMKHDGKDRWYLEALGISMERNSDLYFNTWKKNVNDISTISARDIVWRSRSKDAMPSLAKIIKECKGDEMLRYFRAFDFQTDDSKQQILLSLTNTNNAKTTLYALKHMDAKKAKHSQALLHAIDKALKNYKGTVDYVELIKAFELKNRTDELFALGLQFPDSLNGRMAMNTILDWGNTSIFDETLQQKNSKKTQALIRALWPSVVQAKVMSMMERIIGDSTISLEDRKLAIKTFGGPWNTEDRLLALAKEGKILSDLQASAASVFFSAFRENIRMEGARYLKLPTATSKNTSSSSISALIAKSGNIINGKMMFETNCSSCHRIESNGVNFGPDLSEIGSKLPKEGLFSAILYPDAGISFGFEGYQIKLGDGSSTVGIITSETEDKLELKYMKSVQTIDQNKVVSKSKLDNSLMPSNLNALMNEQQLVDLVEYLASLKKK